MPTETFAGKEVQVDDDGFFVNSSDWNEDMAPILAKEVGIDHLTEDHWTVIKFMRSDYEARGESPTLRRVTTEAHMDTKKIFTLFPGKPAKKMAYVSGVPKPAGCV